MVESLGSIGSLVSSPWIYALVGVSVLLDVFLPLLPSGVLVAPPAIVAELTALVSPASGS